MKSTVPAICVQSVPRPPLTLRTLRTLRIVSRATIMGVSGIIGVSACSIEDWPSFAESTSGSSGHGDDGAATDHSVDKGSTTSTADGDTDPTLVDTDAATDTAADDGPSGQDSTITSSTSSTGLDEAGTASAEDSSQTDDSDASTDSGDDTGGTWSVSGHVTRSVDFDTDNDGRGTMFLNLIDTCGLGASIIDSLRLTEVDMTDISVEVAFEFTAVASGEYFITGFFDDNLSGADMNAIPDSGDLVPVEGVGPGCASITVDGEDLSGVTLDLNLVVP